MKKLKVFAVAIVASGILFTACKKEENKVETPPTPTQKTIAGIATGDTTFSILVAALNKAGLTATLSGTGNFTVFAPTNAAFRKYDITVAEINKISDSAEIEELKHVLLYHVLGSEVKAAQLKNAYVPTLFTVGGNGVSLKTAIAPVKLNASVNVLATTENLTVFAPINQAFTDIKFNLDSTTKEALTPILTAHVLASQVRSNQISNGQKATALNKAVELTFNTTSGVKVSGGKTTDASVIAADIQATNGVVHVINKVILP